MQQLPLLRNGIPHKYEIMLHIFLEAKLMLCYICYIELRSGP